SSVDFGGEDLGALAAAAGGSEESGSGSSLRAKKSADLDKIFADKASTAVGKVVSVEQAKFPETAVTVQILQGPTGPTGDKIKKGAKIKFHPAVKHGGKGVDWSDSNTQANTGAWYLHDGDSVRVKVGKADKDGFEAVTIDRQ